LKNVKENMLNKHKPKKLQKIIDEEGEGYNASNSDNNIEFHSRNKTKARKEQLPENSLNMNKVASKLSHSSSSEAQFTYPQKVNLDASQIWENLEEVGLKN
jgi:hypothetical protein